MTYDNWISGNLEEIEQDKKLDGFDLWLDLEDNTEDLAGYIKKDLACYVAEEGLDWDYPDKIHEQFIEDFEEELQEHYLNNEI